MSELTIAECLTRTKDLESVSDSARLDVELLLAYVLQKDRSYLYTWPEQVLNPAHKNNFLMLLERRQSGEPIAYILGYKYFWDLCLSVDASTLIPRPETELLVETALSFYHQDDTQHVRTVIDLGAGTGAIALALASEKPHWHIMAVDKSADGCRLAKKNCHLCEANNVTVSCSDWLASINIGDVDMIVSNPPYIDAMDPHLQQGDVKFEPRSALVAGNHGLADIEIITQQAKHALKPQGYLLFEHGYQQAQEVTGILQQHGYIECFTMNDIAGHPRVTGARNSGNNR